MERNNGQLFRVEQYERNGYSKDDNKSGGYFSDEDYVGRGSGYGACYGGDKTDRPIFKIKFKPRNNCHVH